MLQYCILTYADNTILFCLTRELIIKRNESSGSSIFLFYATNQLDQLSNH